MAYSLNRATILGNLGRDPELRTTGTGKQVCSFSVATTESYKDQSGEWKDITDWHNVVLWERLADVAAKYLKKGSKVYIEGKIRTRSYEGKDGVTKYMTEIIGQNMIMMGGQQQSQDQGEKTYSQPGNTFSSPEEHIDNSSDFDDEVPF